MQYNTPEENNPHSNNYFVLSQIQLVETLQKWLKQNKKNRRQPHWNPLFFNIAKILMPDIAINQLLIDQQFFIEKVFHLLGICKFRTQNLFNGVQIKLNEVFIAFDTKNKLQKVIIQGSQIKQISPISKFDLIKRGDLTCEQRKQKMLIYNRQKYQKILFLTIELKAIQRIKNDLFKQDYSRKLKFLQIYTFGQGCPSFCASGINIIEINQNQWLKQKTHLNSDNIYLIYSGSFVCFLQNVNQKLKQNQINQFQQSNYEKSKSPSSRKSKRNFSLRIQESSNALNRIQLHKGSIIQTSSFVQIIKKLNIQSSFQFQSSKAISKSVIFQIKSSQFQRVISFDEKCKKYFINQYNNVLNSRKILFSQSLDTINKFLNKNQWKKEDKFQFSITRRKSYKGFRRSKTSKSSLQDMQNLATVEIYDTMIKNKQKVLSLQKQYKDKNKSLQKHNLRYQDNKKLKQNYKRMKIKDFQIQKLVFRNSVSNIKDLQGIKNVRSRLGQVKGMFQDQIQEVQKVIKQQRKAMLQVQVNKQNKNFKRKGIRLKSYSPQTSNYFKQSLTYSKTCQNSNRVSLGESLLSSLCGQLKQQMSKNNFDKSDTVIDSKASIRLDKKKTNSNLPSTFQIVINGGQSQSKKFLYSPTKCINNMTQRDKRRAGRAKTNFKPQMRRISNFNPDSFSKILA